MKRLMKKSRDRERVTPVQLRLKIVPLKTVTQQLSTLKVS